MKVYFITRTANDFFRCTCPAFKFSNAARPTCKHLRSMLGVDFEEARCNRIKSKTYSSTITRVGATTAEFPKDLTIADISEKTIGTIVSFSGVVLQVIPVAMVLVKNKDRRVALSSIFLADKTFSYFKVVLWAEHANIPEEKDLRIGDVIRLENVRLTTFRNEKQVRWESNWSKMHILYSNRPKKNNVSEKGKELNDWAEKAFPILIKGTKIQYKKEEKRKDKSKGKSISTALKRVSLEKIVSGEWIRKKCQNLNSEIVEVEASILGGLWPCLKGVNLSMQTVSQIVRRVDQSFASAGAGQWEYEPFFIFIRSSKDSNAVARVLVSSDVAASLFANIPPRSLSSSTFDFDPDKALCAALQRPPAIAALQLMKALMSGTDKFLLRLLVTISHDEDGILMTENCSLKLLDFQIVIPPVLLEQKKS
eukprot:g1789.t1